MIGGSGRSTSVVAHGILYTEFMNELVELVMYVARHHNVLSIGETEGVYIACRCH